MPGHAGDVVAGVALEADEVGDQLGRDAVAVDHALAVVDLRVGDAARGGHDPHALVDELVGVAVAGDDHHGDLALLRLHDERGDHVVGLEALDRDVPVAERLDQRAQVRPLQLQQIGPARALGLVVRGHLLAARQAGVPHHDRRHLAVVGEDLHEHRREAEDRVRGAPVRRRDRLREREERAVGERVPVDQEELARGVSVAVGHPHDTLCRARGCVGATSSRTPSIGWTPAMASDTTEPEHKTPPSEARRDHPPRRREATPAGASRRPGADARRDAPRICRPQRPPTPRRRKRRRPRPPAPRLRRLSRRRSAARPRPPRRPRPHRRPKPLRPKLPPRPKLLHRPKLPRRRSRLRPRLPLRPKPPHRPRLPAAIRRAAAATAAEALRPKRRRPRPPQPRRPKPHSDRTAPPEAAASGRAARPSVAPPDAAPPAAAPAETAPPQVAAPRRGRRRRRHRGPAGRRAAAEGAAGARHRGRGRPHRRSGGRRPRRSPASPPTAGRRGRSGAGRPRPSGTGGRSTRG